MPTGVSLYLSIKARWVRDRAIDTILGSIAVDSSVRLNAWALSMILPGRWLYLSI